MNTTDYGNRIIVTRTSRNGRRLYFQAFEDLDELAAAIINAIDLDFDPDKRGSAATIGDEKNRAMQDMHHRGRYVGYGGQWIWERVTSDDQLTFWENVRAEQNALRKSGAYLCTGVPDRTVGIDVYQVATGAKSAETMYQATLEQLPPRARFVTGLMVTLWTRIYADDESHFNGWLTRDEASELQRLDLYQPGHSQHRYSIPNEDLSDFAQSDTLGRYQLERDQNGDDYLSVQEHNAMGDTPRATMETNTVNDQTPENVTNAAIDNRASELPPDRGIAADLVTARLTIQRHLDGHDDADLAMAAAMLQRAIDHLEAAISVMEQGV